MPVRKQTQRMTKKRFVKMVTRGALSTDQVIGKVVDELAALRTEVRDAFRNLLCADSRDPGGRPAGFSQLGDLLSQLFSRFAK